jgi:hypothetical protein
MRSFPVDWSPLVGEKPYAEVDPIDQEAAELLAVVHAVDGDNLAASLGNNKVAVGAMGSIVFGDDSSGATVTVADSAVPGDLVPYPDAAGDPLVVVFDSNDGYVEGRVVVEVEQHAAGAPALALVLRLDGTVVARGTAPRRAASGGGTWYGYSLCASFAGPVGSDSHRLEVLLEVRDRPSTSWTVTTGYYGYAIRTVER